MSEELSNYRHRRERPEAEGTGPVKAWLVGHCHSRLSHVGVVQAIRLDAPGSGLRLQPLRPRGGVYEAKLGIPLHRRTNDRTVDKRDAMLDYERKA